MPAAKRGPAGEQARWLDNAQLHRTQRRALIAHIGRLQGNRHLQRVIASLQNDESRGAGRGEGVEPALESPAGMATTHLPSAPVPRAMQEEGRTEEQPLEGRPVREAAETAGLDEGRTNQFDELDGLLTSDVKPTVFVDGGKTGSGKVHWVGGNGGQGNQSVGSIAVRAPVYGGKGPPSGTAGAKAEAYIQPGTGKLKVTRSYRGVLTGANGTTAYITARASTRIDAHEQLHTNSSRSIHNRLIKPLEARIARHTGSAKARSSGTTKAEAIRNLKAFIKWNDTIRAFRTADAAANSPMKSVDIADLASPTYVRDYGPRKVGTRNYTHYYDTPPGPPAAASSP